ncbi:ligase-associated DNA damage response endonuclease PdeM [Pseudomonas sp. D6002]|uniref:ligase-associated DNA damage response endonuclease PdeM n=1 Tax=unclassified Pseudomonas TaxID=196821 RepID=UPI0015A061BD|nr:MULTISPECIES: ligase-associated DNA damage response endonuclease PdeM [unclassified Pseudomonas]NVZ98164.1 ligase-associated DNA damage response endonuclease PdeM [Pseudomonas sp. B6001]NWB17819.1 ligase-associated DNA damage response endonuclease PdeM [Pseudomonas sp. D6002]NWD00467.1 ligase-associated DNA damage response endonuclease PdeM [Pseudomonas sp. P7779]
MPAHYPIHLAEEALWLLADKAVYWPARKCLLIADAHFGKASAYRSLGQPVPQGTTTANLQRLDRLLAAFPGAQVIFLGDFLHGPGSHASGTLNALRAWRERHAGVALTLIRGNHDKRAGDPPGDLNIEVVTEPLLMGPFALQHEPAPHASHHVLAGHVHPVYRLRGKGRQSLRLPCFLIGNQVSLLPAFGAFTGGYSVTQEEGGRIFVIGDQEVWPVR